MPTCYICLEEGDELHHGGCACRGDAGFFHISCAVAAAQQSNETMWHTCPTCKEVYTGQARLALVRQRVELCTDEPELSLEALGAWIDLTRALVELGELHEALQSGSVALDAARRRLASSAREPPSNTLDALHTLALVHFSRAEYEAALQLLTEGIEMAQSVYGDESENAQQFVRVLGSVHMRNGNYSVALPLMKESLQWSQRNCGSDDPETIVNSCNLGTTYRRMGQFELALPLLRDASQRSRQVLGADHSNTLIAAAKLAGALGDAGEHAEAVPLLEHAIAGLIAEYGAQHPLVAEFQTELHHNRERLQ